MKLTYQTATATLIQFITLSFLGLANGANSVATTCHHDGSNCISNLIVSIIFFILTACWFGCVWVLGYAAQEQRNKYLTLALIGAEGLIMLIAYHNATHHTDLVGLVTSLVDLLLAVWIITLAFRLLRSGGKRITTAQRPRKRQRPAV